MHTHLRRLLSVILIALISVSIWLPRQLSTSASDEHRTTKPPISNSPKTSIILDGKNTLRGGKRERELLVRFRLRVSAEQQQAALSSVGIREFKPLRGASRVLRVVLPANQSAESIALALQNNPQVERAEPNYLVYQDNLSSSKSMGPIQFPAIPNDTKFGEQWALHNAGGPSRSNGSDIQITSVWRRTTGNSSIRIAVIDSGIDFSHTDLRNQLWRNSKEVANNKDEDNNGFVDDVAGWDFVENQADIVDRSGHGTNVAGIIAAEGNNGFGITGVLWQANLMNLRILDANGVGDTAAAIEALDYATENGAQVMNLSWGSDEKSWFLKDAIRRSAEYGAVVVCSAGNAGRNLDSDSYYPASFDLANVISVSASDGMDNPLSSTNVGLTVPSIAAPGQDILTTKAGRRTAPSAGEYEAVSGTSAAAAIVSGVVGILKSVSAALTAGEIKNALRDGARRSPAWQGKNEAGGVVSVLGALETTRRPVSGNYSDAEDGQGQQDINQSSNVMLSSNSSGFARETLAGPSRTPRRRTSAVALFPNLDLQKSIRPTTPGVRPAVPSTKRNCNPLLPGCGDVEIPNARALPRRSSVAQSTSFVTNSIIASGDILSNRLLTTIAGKHETLDSLLLKTISPRSTSWTNSTMDVEAPGPFPFTGPTVADYVTEFYDGALHRTPSTTELNFWKDQLKDAKWLGSASLLAMAQYLGNALFLSTEYSASTNTVFVTDLYHGYLQIEPDSNLSYWVSQANTYGREAVRSQFAVSTGFSNLVASVDMGTTNPTTSGNFSTSRIDVVNRTGNEGEDLLSGNVSFLTPILSLPGRSGLNLGLVLAYNSRVWSKVGSTVTFDSDRGFPAPGFRLGFPVIQRRFYSHSPATASYLLITPSGAHLELRRVGSSNVYESADTSHTQLTDNGSSLLLAVTDGTKLTYTSSNGQWVCTEIKDRNGNFITVNYNGAGNINSIVDTLERTVTFNYDSNGSLLSITQPWTVGGSSTTHTWATFSYANATIDTNFSGVYLLWPQDGATVNVLTEVSFADGSHMEFEYNDFGQVDQVERYASNDTLRSQTRYIYDSPSADVPRVTDRYDWIRYANGDTNGAVASGEEARTQFTTGLSGGVLAAPDNTQYKEFYGSSTWQRGLTTGTEVWVGTTKEKWTTVAWDQDNTNVSYHLNPRITETNIYDAADNRRRTTITYTDYSLPDVITEYELNASTAYRKKDTDYLLTSTYTNNRVIGLRSKVEIKDGSNNVKSKTEFTYDSSGEYFTNVTGKDKHDDTNYGSSYVIGRGNLCVVKRYEIGGSTSIETDIGYNSLGQITFVRDGEDHQTNFSYSDSFSDGVNNRNTHAYPTTVEDPDSNDYLSQYNYDFGSVTRTENPLGAVVTQTYDSIGRPDATTSLASTSDTTKQARTRYEYGPDYRLTYIRGFDGTNEAYTNTQFDGIGRVRGVASDFPGSTGGYKASLTYYDVMGRVNEQTNPTEVNSSWAPAGDDSAGFLSTTQTHDWNGRPLVTTNQDETTRTVSYSGCGCAGGEIVTVLDEVNRKRKVYRDVYERVFKTEIYSDPTTVNSTTVTTYNLLDQPTQVREYSGTDSSST